MNDHQNIEPIRETPQNLGFLRFLCILTFLGSGLALFAYFIIGVFYDLFLNADMNPLGENEKEMIRVMLSAGRNFFLLSAMLYAVSLYGAIMMWKLRKPGFHLYSIAQILILILPLLFIPGFKMPFVTILVTVTFIFGYSTFLRSMK